MTFLVTLVDSAAAWDDVKGARPELAFGCAEAVDAAHWPAAKSGITAMATQSFLFPTVPPRTRLSIRICHDDQRLLL
jgi:hypothetical protein